jgi:hypothetical protein
MSSLETKVERKVVNAEKDSLELLEGFSAYLVNLVECFER